MTLEGIADGVAAGLHLIDLAQLAALFVGSVDHGLRDLLHRGKLAVGRRDDLGERLFGLLLVDGRDLVRGQHVGQAQQQRDDQRDRRQRTGYLENEFTFDLHFFAASFAAFLSTPKRVGLVYLSMIQVQQFITRME